MTSKSDPREGERPLKAWVSEIAERERVTMACIWMRLSRGTLAYPKIRRVSRRIVYVTSTP